MDRLRKLAIVVGLVGVLATLSAAPVMATEGGGAETTQEGGAGAPEGGAPAEPDDGKLQLPLDTDKPRDAVGLGILAVVVIILLLAADNARRQLKGERPQASGKWRYR